MKRKKTSVKASIKRKTLKNNSSSKKTGRAMRKPRLLKMKEKSPPLGKPSSPKSLKDDKTPQPVFVKKEPKRQDPEAFEERRRKRREGIEEESFHQDDVTLDRTPMKIYLDQIEHIPLLTPDQEIDLAQKVQAHHKGSAQARHQMIRSNLRLVISIAKRYANMGLPFSDLVEEGNIGLMRAVEKFNPDRGYRFSTYASWWIKQAIMRSLSNQGKTIRIPVYMYDIISKWRKVRDGLTQKLDRVPTRKEIAKMMNVPVQKIREIENIAGRPSSLNAPLSLDGTAELADLIPDDETKGPEMRLGEMLKNDRIYQFLNRLDERERRILILRFGLGNEEMHTLEEVAGQFDITRERVRQIEAIALSKIRAMFIEEKENLSDYLNN